MRQRVVACFVHFFVVHLSISSTNFVEYEAIVPRVTLCSGRKSFNNAEKRVAGAAAAAAVAMVTSAACFVFEHPAEEKNRRKCSTTRQFKQFFTQATKSGSLYSHSR